MNLFCDREVLKNDVSKSDQSHYFVTYHSEKIKMELLDILWCNYNKFRQKGRTKYCTIL